VIALGIRIWMAYGVLGCTTVMLCASVPATAGGQTRVVQVAAASQARQWPSERPPRPLEARPVTFPPYEIRKLANGLQVVIVSHHEQPAVSLRMIVRAGAAHDPPERLGVAMLTASLLDQGAGGRTAEQIADAIDFVGGVLGTGAGTDLTYLNAIVLKDSLPLALQLLSDVARRPTFAQEELDRQRQQALSGLQVQAEDPDAVASRVINRLIYGFHPYGLPGTGTAQSLATVTRDEVISFHRRYYVPNNALLAVVGDVTPDEAMKGVEQAFGDWQPGEVPTLTPIDPPAPTRRVIVIDKPDAVQTEIRVGQIGIPRRHPDYMAMDQAVKILGGEGANRLQQVLRSQRGLTYGASAELDTYKMTGGIVAETDTRTEATAEALRLTIDEFWRLQRERVYDAELMGAQAYLAGNFPLTIETPAAIATQVLNHLFYELPLEELKSYPERVRSVTPDDVQRVARTYFNPDRLAIVLVGNASAFANDLKGVGFPDYERIPIAQLDLLAADLKRGGASGVGPPRGPGDELGGATLWPPPYPEYRQSQPPPAPPAAVAPIDAIVRKAIDAHGGREAIAGVQRLVAEGTTTLMTPEGQVTATTRTSIEYPDRVRVDANLPDARIVQVFADGKGWLQDPRGVHDAPLDMLKDFHASVLRDPLALLRGIVANTYTVRHLPDERSQNRVHERLEITGDRLPPVRLSFDADSGLLVKIAYEARGVTPLPTEELFDDYRRVDDVNLPFKASVLRNGAVILERQLTGVTVNPVLAPDTFARPGR
jgi:zinc protease